MPGGWAAGSPQVPPREPRGGRCTGRRTGRAMRSVRPRRRSLPPGGGDPAPGGFRRACPPPGAGNTGRPHGSACIPAGGPGRGDHTPSGPPGHRPGASAATDAPPVRPDARDRGGSHPQRHRLTSTVTVAPALFQACGCAAAPVHRRPGGPASRRVPFPYARTSGDLAGAGQGPRASFSVRAGQRCRGCFPQGRSSCPCARRPRGAIASGFPDGGAAACGEDPGPGARGQGLALVLRASSPRCPGPGWLRASARNAPTRAPRRAARPGRSRCP